MIKYDKNYVNKKRTEAGSEKAGKERKWEKAGELEREKLWEKKEEITWISQKLNEITEIFLQENLQKYDL